MRSDFVVVATPFLNHDLRFSQRVKDFTVQQFIAKLDPLFPAATPEQNWLLCETLCFLQAPSAAAKGMALIAAAPNQEEQIEYARSLRMLKAGFNADTDGLAGIQELAGNATGLFYQTAEGQEGRNAWLEKRAPDFGKYRKRP